MKVLLINVDSKIPNLALMKLSAFHKAQGDSVSWSERDPERIYASVIFDKNAHKTDAYRFLYPRAQIIIGGTGKSLETCLRDEIEQLKPDYDLYPKQSYSMGFTTRGCIRRCSFCVVPQKEGRFRRAQHPREFHDERFDTIFLLDNNWIADRAWFFETSEWIIEKRLKLIENGLDARLLDEEIVAQLKRLRRDRLHFAWDFEEDEKEILEGIRLLNAGGISTKDRCLFYVYVNGDQDFDSALRRCKRLKEARATAFIMLDPKGMVTPRIRKLQWWANRPWVFWSDAFENVSRARK